MSAPTRSGDSPRRGGDRAGPSDPLVPGPRRSADGPEPAGAATAPSASRAAVTARGEIGQLTGVRFVAALWVLAHHASFLPVDVYGRWLAPVAPLVAAGPLGVDLFFVLSGLVLARSYLERWGGLPRPRQAADFVWARVARIWPLYAVVVSLFGLWCLARAHWGGDGVVTWQYAQPDLGPAGWLAQLTMTQLWGSSTIDGISFVLPMWSVSAEWAAYLAFALLGVAAWWLRRLPAVVLGFLAVAAAAAPAVVGVVLASGLDGAVFPWGARVGGGFAAGVLTWLTLRRIPATPTTARWAHRVVLLALGEILLVVLWAAAPPPSAALAAPERLLFAVPLFPVLLGALTLADRGPTRWLATPWMRAGGRLSYALYLVHFPMIEITWVAMTRFGALAPGSTGAALLVPHVLLAAFGVAWLAHRWVEVPAQAWMRRAGRRGARAGDGPGSAAWPVSRTPPPPTRRPTSPAPSVASRP